MPGLISAAVPKRFKLLQSSASGTGKTYRSLSSTQFGKVYFFDLDEKLVLTSNLFSDEVKSLVDYDNYTDDIAINKVSSKSEVIKYGYNKVMDKVLELKRECPYNTVVLDTWSRLFDLMDFKLFNKRPKEWSDWELIKEEQKEFLNRLFSIDANIIVNAHAGIKENKLGKEVITVGTPGAFGEKMPESFNETHYLFYDNLTKMYKAQGKFPNNVVCNSALAASHFDERGCFKVSDLSVFKDIAKKG